MNTLKSIGFALLVSAIAIGATLLILQFPCELSSSTPGCGSPTSPGVQEETPPTEPTRPPALTATDFDGLSQAVFDTTVRIRNREGTGSGSIISESNDVYEIETNRHVANDRGYRNVIDIWTGGHLVASVPEVTVKSWFEDGKSKDIAILHVKKAMMKQELAVVPTAPPGYEKQLKAGDKVYMIGCSDGRWPRARCGNILKIQNGLIYYDPESIGGDSGSGVYHFSIADQKWYCCGRTAWALQEGKRWVGLAMSSDRVRAIREGRVSTGWQLPAGAVPLTDSDCPWSQETKNSNIELPNDAIRLDLIRTQAPAADGGEEPQPLDTGLFRNREVKPREPLIERPLIERPLNNKPVRKGFGDMLAYVGLGLGAGLCLAVVIYAFRRF